MNFSRYFTILFLLFLTPLAYSAQTIVTARITDPNGQAYANGSGRASIVCPGNQQPSINGSPVSRTIVITQLDGFGGFTQTFFDTNSLDQQNCGTVFAITDSTTTVSFTTPTLFTVTGISVNLSTQISSFAAPLPNSGGGGGGLQNVSSLPVLCTPGITNPVNLTTFPYGVYACTSLNTWTSWTIGSNGQINRFQPVLGTALTSTDFSLSGWGSGASIGSITGTDTDFQYTITAGTAPTSAPTVILTYHDGPWISITSASSWMTNGSGVIQDIASSSTITAMTMTYTGIPISGNTYIINGLVMGNTNVTNFPISVNPVVINPTASQTVVQPTGTILKGTSPGVFTNTQPNQPFQFNLNGCDPGVEYNAVQVGQNTTDALAGCVAVPSASGVNQSNGIAGYAVNRATGANPNAMGVYGQARCLTNSTNCWASNFGVRDNTGLTTVTLIGNETDIDVLGASTTAIGYSSKAVFVTNPATSRNFVCSSVSTFNWGQCFYSDDGASQGFAQIGMLNASGLSKSQGLFFRANDGTNTHIGFVQSDSNGDMLIGNSDAPAFVRATIGGDSQPERSFLSPTPNAAAAGAGILRLSVADSISWRNNANTGNLGLFVNVNDQLDFNGSLVSHLTATSAAFATATTAGTCVQSTTAVIGATTAMAVTVSPVSTPGVGAQWSAFVSSAGNVTINECAVAASAGGTIAFNIRVIQ